MKKLLVLSGKGGTGKTTISAALIGFANAKAFADCDGMRLTYTLLCIWIPNQNTRGMMVHQRQQSNPRNA